MGLLVADLVAVTGMGPRLLLADLFARVDGFHIRRINLRLTSDLAGSSGDKEALLPEQVTIDGNKFLLENDAWVLFRKSGTEPVVRVYGEARDAGTLEKILLSAKEFVLS